jgi:hypothetical protein
MPEENQGEPLQQGLPPGPTAGPPSLPSKSDPPALDGPSDARDPVQPPESAQSQQGSQPTEAPQVREAPASRGTPQGWELPKSQDAREPPRAEPSSPAVNVPSEERLKRFLKGEDSSTGATSEIKINLSLDVRAAKAERGVETVDEEPTDPTTVFQHVMYPDINFKADQIEEWSTKLQKNRILALPSYDPEFLYAAAEAIVSSPAFSHCEKRDLSLENTGFDIDRLIKLASGKRPRVVAAYAIDEMSRSFLKTLRPDPPTVGRQIESLRKRDLYLLIVSRTPFLSEIEQRDPTQHFTYIERSVDFLGPRLSAAYGSEAGAIAETLRYHQEQGLWSSSEERFFVDVQARIRDRTLRQTIARYQEAINTGTTGALKSAETPVMAETLLEALPGGDPALQQLYQWVLFTATFFPGLPMGEFTRVLRQLIPEPLPETPPAEGRPVLKPKSLFDHWSLQEPKILKLCQLRLEPRKLEAPAIVFVETVLGSEMERAFRSMYYGHFEHAITKIEEAGLVADRSPLIRQAVVKVLATRAIQEANYYGKRFALDVLYSYARARRPGGAPPALSGELATLTEGLPQEISAILYNQVASVILAVSEKDQQVAEAGLAQLKGIGVLDPVLRVLRHGSRSTTSPKLSAAAAAILLTCNDTDKAAESLRLVRLALRDPANGALLTCLLSDLPRNVACGLLRYLTQFALKGFVTDIRANPLASAFNGLAHQPDFKVADFTVLADLLTADEFAAGFSEDDFWFLFQSWLAPESLRADRLLLLLRLVAAIHSATERVVKFIVLHSRISDSLLKLLIPAMLLADTYIWIESVEQKGHLVSAVSRSLDKKRRSECSLLLNELATGINDGVLSLQPSGQVVDRGEQQKRLQFVTRWKRLRDALRQVKVDIEHDARKSASVGER